MWIEEIILKFRKLKEYITLPFFPHQLSCLLIWNGKAGIQNGLVTQGLVSPDFLPQYFLFLLMSLLGFGITVMVASQYKSGSVPAFSIFSSF